MSKFVYLTKRTLRRLKEPKVLVSFFLAAIMIFSILGYMVSYQTDEDMPETEYNGYKFEQLYGGVQTEINGEKVMLTYFPEQLLHINLSKDTKIVLANMPVFAMTYDSDSEYREYFSEQQFKLSENLARIDRYIVPGMTNNTGFEQIPQIRCENATANMPVILFKEAAFTNITFNNNCIIANIADMNDVYQAGDLLFYYMAGIME